MTALHVVMSHGSIAPMSMEARCSIRNSDNEGISLDYCGLVLINMSGSRQDGHVVFKSAQG